MTRISLKEPELGKVEFRSPTLLNCDFMNHLVIDRESGRADAQGGTFN